jgi:preprotein translocase subunit SecY
MANPIQNLFRFPELKDRIVFTLLILLIYRVGSHITVPGVNLPALEAQFGALSGTLFGVYDAFVGGGLSKATIFALGIMPYISASIMFQLLAAVFPVIEKLQKEGEDGRKRLTQWTRYTTLALCVLQAYGYSVFVAAIPGAATTSTLAFTAASNRPRSASNAPSGTRSSRLPDASAARCRNSSTVSRSRPHAWSIASLSR